jgi:hypothetical protein
MWNIYAAVVVVTSYSNLYRHAFLANSSYVPFGENEISLPAFLVAKKTLQSCDFNSPLILEHPGADLWTISTF